MLEIECPTCGGVSKTLLRYPRSVCQECRGIPMDKDGKLLSFWNTTLLGTGCIGKYVDSGEEYNSNICYIKGKECFAEEAKFGGIVIQTKE
jgi:hypothetical protein